MRHRILLLAIAIAAGIASGTFAHADIGALERRVELLSNQGKYIEAIEVARQALAEAESALGPDHARTARSLNNLAFVYTSQGRFEEALPLYRRALEINEKALGPNHPSTALSINNLAFLYRSMGRYEEAVTLFNRALAVRERVLGPNHPDTAMSLNNLAAVYEEMGRYDEPRPMYERALKIHEAALGPDHPKTAMSLNNLAELNRRLGLYDEALPLYKRAQAINERTIGLSHPNTATGLNNLARLYGEMGRYSEALALYKQALAINETAPGPNHPDTARSLNNLAGLYSSMGRYDEALPLYKRGLAINEKALGPDHASTATSLNNLAQLYESLGHYDEALRLQRQALAITEKALGPDHASTATSLNNLAGLYKLTGSYEAALRLYNRALVIREKAQGPNHPDTAMSLNNLAALYGEMGDYSQAFALQRRALAISEKTLGADHVSTAASLNNLAKLYESMGSYGEAIALYRRAARVVSVPDIKNPNREHGAIEAQAIASANLARALNRRQDSGSQDEAIFYLKLSVNALQRMRAGTRGLDATTRKLFTRQLVSPYQSLSELLIQRGRIAEGERVLLLLKESELTEYLRRSGGNTAERQDLNWTPEEQAYRQDLDRVAGEWREFEQQRIAVEEGIKSGRLSESGPELVELEQRRLQLETRTANIMADATRRFVEASEVANRQREWAFDNARTELSAKLTELRLRGDGGLRTAGLLLLPSERGLTLIVTTEQGAVPLMRKVSEAELGALVKSLRHAIQNRKDYRVAAQSLHRHLIDPAEAQLDGAKDIQQWAIMPFGSLRALPFATLVRPDGKHLIERYAVTMLTADGTGRLEGLETANRETWRGVALGASQPDAEFGSVALPGVRREVCGVVRDRAGNGCHADEGLIGGQRYLDKAFTPDVLQRLFGPSSGGANFLHIATHFKVEKSLLLLGDGSKLSTEQILAWTPRLGQYDLIALSACDSGISDGAIESLAGLLRAKGAKAVLATLWSVADVGAAPLMVEFYRQRGEKRAMSKAAALREAQLAMITGRIRDDTGAADLRHAYFWAPYILLGNWL